MTRVSSVALATCAALPEGASFDWPLAEALRERGASATFAVWDDPGVEWERFDRVVVRSTWDYTSRRDDFLRWARSLDDRLHNRPAVLEWNSDKRYLADLERAGVATVPTLYAGADDPEPPLEGEVVVKPTISAGARDTGRFGPQAHGDARRLLARLRAAGRTAMVQPYQTGVEQGETAIVAIAGAESHVLSKRPVLGPDEEAPLAENEIGAAKAMFDEDLVGPGSAGPAERELAQEVIAHLRERFGEPPLYARFDMIAGEDGAPLLLELELVEPSLYLEHAPQTAARLADAVLAAGSG